MIRIQSFALGVGALLLVSGMGGCAGSSRSKPPSPGNPPVAVVNGRYITRHDVDSVLATAPAGVREDYLKDPEQYKGLVERIVNQEAMYQAATQARAKEVLRKLRTSTWDEVAARYSTDKLTAKNGGILGFVTNDTAIVPGIGNAPAVVAAAFKLKEGETSEPLKSSKGWHVIRADERAETGPQKYEAVQRQIRSNLENQRTEHFQTDLIASAKWMIENMEHGVPPPSVGMPDTLIMKGGGLGAPPGGTNSRP